MELFSRKRFIIVKNGNRSPLFWVSPVLRQYNVMRQLGPDRPVYGLCPPEMDLNSLPLTFDQIATYYMETIRGLRPHGPYALTGWCAAAAISFEIARQLRSQGEVISALIMVDPLDPALSRASLVREPFFFRARFNFNRILFHLHRIEKQDTRFKLVRWTRSMALIVRRFKDNMTEYFQQSRIDSSGMLPPHLLNIQRPDVYAFRNHLPHHYAGSAILIRPTIFKYAFEYANRRWAQLINERLEIRAVPGDSESMWLDPNARVMSRIINSCLS